MRYNQPNTLAFDRIVLTPHTLSTGLISPPSYSSPWPPNPCLATPPTTDSTFTPAPSTPTASTKQLPE
ncbi:hypothetical protein SBOR_5525 [Sclerotinia borealis F-4128]|uniref:Uncharacterized protein n=1 Tax=Sclerotinia borealis (strain F-4128) TaxID=1432307 RepID=W9CHS8_SCLBF|nr:hypothetical protein SBOR_5525 [Sclerotinia borealis F-4128]